METTETGSEDTRRSRLHAIARAYVSEGLGKGNFDAIPYHENVSLRAPLCPGGSAAPLVGRENLRNLWWAPIPSLVSGVQILDTYVNQSLSACAVEFLLDIADPPCTLRVLDRFTIDEGGEILAQENFFDPRDLTNPGWRSSS